LQGGGILFLPVEIDQSTDPTDLRNVTIFLENVTLRNNTAAEGAGLYTNWPVTVKDCTFEANNATWAVSIHRYSTPKPKTVERFFQFVVPCPQQLLYQGLYNYVEGYKVLPAGQEWQVRMHTGFLSGSAHGPNGYCTNEKYSTQNAGPRLLCYMRRLTLGLVMWTCELRERVVVNCC
jgi:hypothetical protein